MPTRSYSPGHRHEAYRRNQPTLGQTNWSPEQRLDPRRRNTRTSHPIQGCATLTVLSDHVALHESHPRRPLLWGACHGQQAVPTARRQGDEQPTLQTPAHRADGPGRSLWHQWLRVERRDCRISDATATGAAGRHREPAIGTRSRTRNPWASGPHRTAKCAAGLIARYDQLSDSAALLRLLSMLASMPIGIRYAAVAATHVPFCARLCLFRGGHNMPNQPAHPLRQRP